MLPYPLISSCYRMGPLFSRRREKMPWIPAWKKNYCDRLLTFIPRLPTCASFPSTRGFVRDGVRGGGVPAGPQGQGSRRMGLIPSSETRTVDCAKRGTVFRSAVGPPPRLKTGMLKSRQRCWLVLKARRRSLPHRSTGRPKEEGILYRSPF